MDALGGVWVFILPPKHFHVQIGEATPGLHAQEENCTARLEVLKLWGGGTLFIWVTKPDDKHGVKVL